MSSYSVSKRNSNIEALRVLSMLLIILLHFFYQGGILKTIKPQDGIHFYIVWTLEAFALVSVNCFILISGYFLCEAKFKLKKICLLLLQIWFYSVVLYLVCCAFKYDTFNIKTLILVYLFPTITGKWWYASVYVALYFIFPYINLALKHLTRKQHLYLICTLVMIFSFIPVLIFFSIDTLGHLNGYSLLWFIVLYIIAAYLRKYPDSIDLKPVHYALGYIACSLCTAGIKFIQLNYRQHEYWNFYSYHSPTVLLGSICLFLFFVKIKPLPFVAFWNYIGGGSTFAVFLIHTHLAVREKVLWPIIKPYENIGRYGYMLISVFAIFIICVAIDMIRRLLFMPIERSKHIAELLNNLQSRFMLYPKGSD